MDCHSVNVYKEEDIGIISIFVHNTSLFFSNPYIFYVYLLFHTKKILQVYSLDSVSSGIGAGITRPTGNADQTPHPYNQNP